MDNQVKHVQDFGILVLSCDKYSHVWPGFFQCFRRNFSNCPWPIYLGSNVTPCFESGVTSILSGPDEDWSTSLLRILRQLPHKKVLIILEDLFVGGPVDLGVLNSAVEFSFKKDARLIKYFNPLPHDQVDDNPLFGICQRGAPYRATVAGIWDKAYLEGLLIPGESPWNFEILGSYRTSYQDGFYNLLKPFCPIVHMIEKGCWFAESLAWAREQGLHIDESKRPVLSGWDRSKSWLQRIYFQATLRFPWRWRVKIMNLLRKLLVSY